MKEKISRILEGTPKESRETIPFYYEKVMRWTYKMLFAYLISCNIACITFGYYRVLIYALPLAFLSAFAHYLSGKVSYQSSHLLYIVCILIWIWASTRTFGWGIGTIQLLLPALVINFFSIYFSTFRKILWLVFFFAVRIVLFVFAQKHGERFVLDPGQKILFQALNSLMVYIHTGVVCYIFSSNIQQSEKKLMIYAEEQSIKAKTDPLTRLMNRGSMEELLKSESMFSDISSYSIGMMDIDLFKHVNDTYGHEAGDVVLQEIGDLLARMCAGKVHVARWGGEEFLFFMPGYNLDEASALMTDINVGISRKTIRYKEMEICVTVTIGIEEDFRPDYVEQTIRKADEKLYLGKQAGRNRVIA